MNANVVSRLVAVIGIIALPVTAAHAGHGQGGSSLSGFECHVINGANSDRIVTITDQFGTADNVRVGAAKLLCGPATVDKRPDDPDFDAVPGSPDHLKCYAISVPGQPGPNPVVRVVDPLNGGAGDTDGESVQVLPSRYICTFADKFE